MAFVRRTGQSQVTPDERGRVHKPRRTRPKGASFGYAGNESVNAGRRSHPRAAAIAAFVVALMVVMSSALVGAAPDARGQAGETPDSYSSEVLADSPSAYWRLGESSGTTVVDETGANPGTYTGGVTLGQPGALQGSLNTSVSLDGVNDYASAPDSDSLDATTGVSIEAWAKRVRSNAFQVIVGKPGNGQSKHENYALWFDSGNYAVAYFGD
jgi:hypothetical protein